MEETPTRGTGHKPEMCASHEQRHWLLLFQTVFSRMLVEWTTLEDKDYVALRKNCQDFLLPSIIKIRSPPGRLITKHLGSLISGLLSCNTHNPLHIQLSVGPSAHGLVGIRAREAGISVTTLAVPLLWIIKSFVSEPGVLCLLPTFVRLCQANLVG